MFLIDVSANNGIIDWAAVQQFKPVIDGAYVKVSEGINCPDAQTKNNASKLAALKFKHLGYYHFASLNTHDVTHDASDEATEFCLFLSKLPQATLPPVLDIESNPTRYQNAAGKFVREADALNPDRTVKAGLKVIPPLSKQEVEVYTRTFIDTMHQKGYNDVVIYSYTPFLDAHLPQQHSFGNNKLWIAQYPTVLPSKPKLPRGWVNCWLWQYTSKGRVTGIRTDVDFNKTV